MVKLFKKATEMEASMIYFTCILFVVAFLYSSVGHGGASGYLALMALFGMAPALMRPSALLLNLFVAGIAFYQFYRSGYFRWRLFWPFAVASIPAAFIGANINLDPFWYKRILGVCLFIATLRITGVFGNRKSGIATQLPIGIGLLCGGIIGLFSGMIGIGGGIVLSPLILLLGWGNVKETAAVSAIFIFVNSASGLSGLMLTGAQFYPQMYVFIIVALLAGLVGAYSASIKLDTKVVRQMLAAVLIIASVKLFIL